MQADHHPNAIHEALAHHRAGRLDQAQAIYEAILETQPDYADGLHLLGVIAFQRREFEKSLPLIERAVRLSPQSSAYHCSLGNLFGALGQVEEAKDAYAR